LLLHLSKHRHLLARSQPRHPQRTQSNPAIPYGQSQIGLAWPWTRSSLWIISPTLIWSMLVRCCKSPGKT